MSTKNHRRSTYYCVLMDAINERQYALKYINHRPGDLSVLAHCDPYREGTELEVLGPYETVVAFVDQHRIEIAGDHSILHTLIYQIKTDASGRKEILSSDAAYTVFFWENAKGGFTIEYRILHDSLQKIRSVGIDLEFPESYRADYPIERATTCQESGFQPLRFPPHQKDGADLMRVMLSLTEVMGYESDYFERGMLDESISRVVSAAPVSCEATSTSYKVSDREIEDILKEYATDLTLLAREGKLDPVVGRLAETEQAIKALTRRKRSSIAFTGPGGVGKTAMFSAVALALGQKSQLPTSLQNARVLSLDISAMMAGAKYAGEFEQRIKPLIDGLTEREGILKGQKVILAIDEIHAQLSATVREESGNAGNLMKPFLAAKGISVMGATTGEEYRRYIEKDSALARRFESVRIDPPDRNTTRQILLKLWPFIKRYNHIETDVNQDQLDYIISMTDRYSPEQVQPDKAEAALNMAAASAEYRGSTFIAHEDIIAAIAQMSGLSIGFLNKSEDEKILALEEKLPCDVMGQVEVMRIVDGLMGAKSGLTDEKQPLGCFVLQGPTGTGKTETARAVAKHLFGSEDALIKIDMSQFREPHTVSRLIGAPPGYIGFDTVEPALTEKVRHRPYAVILLDEIEKAHPDVFNILLPVLNDGKVRDNQGRIALFNNVLFIITSNLGAREAMDHAEKLQRNAMHSGVPANPETIREEIACIYEEFRRNFFRPELISRVTELGGFLTFHPLSQEVVKELVKREISFIKQRLMGKSGANLSGVKIQISDETLDDLVKAGYHPSSGARHLRGVVRAKIANPLGKLLMKRRKELEAAISEYGSVTIEFRDLDTMELQPRPSRD